MAKEISYEETVQQVPVGSSYYIDKVNTEHLLQVIRDMDRRLEDLERKLEQKNVT